MSKRDDRYKIVRRKTEKTNAVCRGCDKTFAKGEEIIYTYSSANRGQHIMFCLDCGEVIANLVMNIIVGDRK